MANTSARRAGWALPVLELFGLTVLAFLVSLAAGVTFIVPMFVLGYDLAGTAVLLGATAAGQLAFLAVGYAYVRVRGVPVPVRRPDRDDLVAILGGTVLALVTATGLSVLLSMLDLVPDSVIGDVVETDPTFLLGLAALSVVLVAPAEELLFRGAIQGRLRQRVGPIPAVLGASLLFGSMHLSNYSGAFATVVAGALLITAVGSILGALYEYTDNLVVPVVTHAAYNVVLMLLAYLTI